MRPVTDTELDDRFTYHPAVDAATVAAHTTIRSEMRRAAQVVADTCPESREKNLALTSLQEAMMWANAAVAIHSPDQ